MLRKVLTTTIFLISSTLLVVFIFSATPASANGFTHTISSIWNFIFGSSTTPPTEPVIQNTTVVHDTNIPTTVVTPPSPITTYTSNTLTDTQLYDALSRIKLPQNIINQLRGPQGPQGIQGPTGSGSVSTSSQPSTVVYNYLGSSGGNSSSSNNKNNWQSKGDNIYYSKGNVGINTNSPDANLAIQAKADGPELVTNGTFDGSADGWTVGTGWTYADGKITHTPGQSASLSLTVHLIAGHNYTYSFDNIGATQGCATLYLTDLGYLYGGYLAHAGQYTDAGTVSGDFAAQTSGDANIVFNPSDCDITYDGSIDNFSIKEKSASLAVNSTSGDAGFLVDNSGNVILSQGLYSDLNVKTALANYAEKAGASFYVHTDSDNTSDFSKTQISGLDINVDHDAPSVSGGLTGININVNNSGSADSNSYVTPLNIGGSFYGAGTGGEYRGINLTSYSGNGAHVDRVSDIFISGTGVFGTGTIANHYGIFMDAPYGDNVATGITNNYGLYIIDQSGSGTNSNYNIYSGGAGSTNYFEGNVGIGATTPNLGDRDSGAKYLTIYSDTQDKGGTLELAGLNTQAGAPVGTLAFTQNGFGSTAAASIYGYRTSTGNGYLGLRFTAGGADRMTIDDSGNVGIGTASPSAKLSIDASGSDITPLSIKTNGSVGNYTSTNSGIFMYDASGEETLRIVATDPDPAFSNYNVWNLYIGRQAGFSQPSDNSSAGYANDGVGYQALYSNTVGINNDAFGVKALYSNVDGQSNQAFGYQALEGNISGYYNQAIGESALANNFDGWSNTAIGLSAMESNRSGSNNVAIGQNALINNQDGNYNTAIGFNASVSSRDSTSTIAIGRGAAGGGNGAYHNIGSISIGEYAGSGFTTGSDYNTFLGFQSGYGVSSGARNIFIGPSTILASKNQITTGSNNIAIGNDVAVPSDTASNQLNIGNFIYGTGFDGTGSTVSNGFVGIGNTTPSVALDVTGDIEYTGTITDVSDKRLKENITDYTGALDVISQLQAKSYNMIISPDRPETGFIAQDVQQIFPQAVSIIDPTNGYLGVSYVSLVPVIAEAVKELNLKVDNLVTIPTDGSENSFLTKLVAWLANAENHITRIFTGEICLTSPGEDAVCLNSEELKALKDSLIQTPAITPVIPDPIPSTPTDTNPDTSTPAPEVTPPSETTPPPAPDLQTPPTDTPPASDNTAPTPTPDPVPSI